MSTNSELADTLRAIADLLDLAGERFKPEAYRRASRTIDSLTEDIRAVAGRGKLDTLPGVGAAISEKIREYLATGAIEYYERIRRASPPGLLEIMRLPGLGPKTARRFWTELGVEGPTELAAAIEAGRLTALKGFGPKKIELIRKALQSTAPPGIRTPLRAAARLAQGIVDALRRGAPVDQVEVAGSLRRGRESVGDLDILVTSHEPEKVFDAFSALPGLREITLRGPTKETIVLGDGVQVDLRVVEPVAFGAALQYFTGSKDHNVRLRSLARDRGLRINEYGVFRDDERVAGATEAEVYGALELPWIPPEIREDRGEISAARAGTLPRLVEGSDLRGQLHVHASADLPVADLARLLDEACARKWEYLGLILSDDSAPVRERWRRQAGGRLRLLFGEERTSWVPPAPGGHGPAFDFWLLRADRAGLPPEVDTVGDGAGPLVATHLRTGEEGAPSDPSTASAWLEWSAASGTALEVTETGAEGGLDALLVRRSLERGGRIHVTVPIVEAAPGELALRTARRGWATREQVLNASSFESRTRRPPPGRPTRP